MAISVLAVLVALCTSVEGARSRKSKWPTIWGSNSSAPVGEQERPGGAKVANKCGKSFKVVPYSVLGTNLDGGFNPKAGPEPESDAVIVDPAGLDFIQHYGPGSAGAAARAIYDFVGLRRDFPADVKKSVTDVLMAKYHDYSKVGVIHAVGPQLGRCRTGAEALDKLTTVYSNVLQEFSKSRKQKLRLLPISSGIFAGHYKRQMPGFTFAALDRAIEEAAPEVRQALQAADVEMCIFDQREFAAYEVEGERIC